MVYWKSDNCKQGAAQPLFQSQTLLRQILSKSNKLSYQHRKCNYCRAYLGIHNWGIYVALKVFNVFLSRALGDCNMHFCVHLYLFVFCWKGYRVIVRGRKGKYEILSWTSFLTLKHSSFSWYKFLTVKFYRFDRYIAIFRRIHSRIWTSFLTQCVSYTISSTP